MCTPPFSPASCWPRGSLELPELCPLTVGTGWRQVLVMPPSESKKGQIYPALSPFAGAGLALGTMDLREQPPPPGRRELSFLGSIRPRSCHSFCTDFFHYPLGYSPGIWPWNTAHPRMSNPAQERGAARGKTDVAPAQAAMGSLLLSMLSLPYLPTPPGGGGAMEDRALQLAEGNAVGSILVFRNTAWRRLFSLLPFTHQQPLQNTVLTECV